MEVGITRFTLNYEVAYMDKSKSFSDLKEEFIRLLFKDDYGSHFISINRINDLISSHENFKNVENIHKKVTSWLKDLGYRPDFKILGYKKHN